MHKWEHEKSEPSELWFNTKNWCGPWSEYACNEGWDACIECFHVAQVLFSCLTSEPARSIRRGFIISELRCQAMVRQEAGKLQATGMLWAEQEGWEERRGWTSQLPPSASETSQQTCLLIGRTTSTAQHLINYLSRELQPSPSRRLSIKWTCNSRPQMKQTTTTTTTGQT